MRKPLIAGNWKMNTTVSEGLALIHSIHASLSSTSCDVVICPPFTHLASFSEICRDKSFFLGAQNMSVFESGAYTGEVSPGMLRDIGIPYVIIGHSERRTLFFETDDIIAKKLALALSYQLTPILCIGESLEARENGRALQIIKQQLDEGLRHITSESFSLNNAVIAYEPIWAIGTGKVASSEEAQEVHSFIRDYLTTRFSDAIAEKTRVLYGGSVKPDNAQELLSKPDIDGALVGGASLVSDAFLGIINAAMS